MKDKHGKWVQLPNLCTIIKDWTGEQTVWAGIKALEEEEHGGLGYIKLVHPGSGMMPLSIDGIGRVRRETRPFDMHVSMSHNYVQNGDLMDDPRVDFWLKCEPDFETMSEMVFWLPYAYTQHGLGVYRHYITDDYLITDERNQADLAGFCIGWDNNLLDQGYVGLAGLAENIKAALRSAAQNKERNGQ